MRSLGVARGRPPRFGGSTTAFSRMLSALAGGSVFTASYYAYSGAKVTDWIDWLDPTHTLTQATDANRAPLPVADSALGGALSSTHAALQYYGSSRAASTWKRFHDGTGGGTCTIWVPHATHTSNLYLGFTSTGSGEGAYCTANDNGTDGRIGHNVRNSGGSIVNPYPAGDWYTQGTGNVLRADYLEGASPGESRIYSNGTLAGSANTSAGPTSGNPALTLYNGYAAASWSFRWHATIVPPAAWTAAQIAAVDAYVKSLGLVGA